MVIGQRDHYTTKEQQALDANSKTIQQVNFTGNLPWKGVTNIITFFNIEEAKEAILKFFSRNCESIVNVFHNLICLNIMWI